MPKATKEQQQVIEELMNGVKHYPKYVPKWLSIILQNSEVRNNLIPNEIKKMKNFIGFNTPDNNSADSNKIEIINANALKNQTTEI